MTPSLDTRFFALNRNLPIILQAPFSFIKKYFYLIKYFSKLASFRGSLDDGKDQLDIEPKVYGRNISK